MFATATIQWSLLLVLFQHLTCTVGSKLNVLVVFDVHTESATPNCTGFNMEALRHISVLEYAIFRANATDDVIVDVIDTCGDGNVTLNKLYAFMGGQKQSRKNGDVTLTAILIDSSQEVITTVTMFASLFSIPVINVARIVETEDVPSANRNLSSLVNMAPSREVLSDAVTAFLKQKDIPYVQVVSSDTPYHRHFLHKMNERTSMRDCCIVTQFEISKNITEDGMAKLLDGLLKEARTSAATIMITTESDFEYLLQELAKRNEDFGPLFIGLNKPPDSWIVDYSTALVGATFLQSVMPSTVNMTDYEWFVRQSLFSYYDGLEVVEGTSTNSLISCQLFPGNNCTANDWLSDMPIKTLYMGMTDALTQGVNLALDFVSSYIQTGVGVLLSGIKSAHTHDTHSCFREQHCYQKVFHDIITSLPDCSSDEECAGAAWGTASVFNVYSVTLGLDLLQAGQILGIHSHVEWPEDTHLDEYWQIMNVVRFGFRLECRTKVRNKYAVLNTGVADAYVIGVLHSHKEQTTPSGCDENGVHREHILRAEAILYAVDKLNAEKEILPNITLGAIIIDSCYITDKIVQQVVDIVNGQVKVNNAYGLLSQPIGMIGPSSSDRLTIIAPTIQSYKIPIVSFSASSPVLSDKHKYPLFFRPIASDVKQAEAMVDLLKHYGWNYFGCVYSSTDYGTYGIREVIKRARQNGMKVAYQLQMDDSYTDDERGLDYVFKHFISDRMDEVKVVVAFLETRHAEEIFKVAERHDVKGLVWVGSDSFTDSDTAAKSAYAVGSIGVVFNTAYVADFADYINSINARNYTRNPFYLDLVESKLNCHLREENKLKYPEPCPADSRLVYSEVSSGGEASTTIDCVLSLAYGLDFLLERYCSGGELCSDGINNIKNIPSMMTEVIFTGASGEKIMFDSKGDGVGRYDFINLRQPVSGTDNEYVKFANWDTGKLTFTNSVLKMRSDGQMIPVSTVTASCHGEFCSSTSAEIVGLEYAYIPGKLMLHAFLPVHYYDGAISACSALIDHSGFEAVVAALWAVNMINAENFFPGLNLGLAVYDTCSNPSLARQLAHEVVQSTFLVTRPKEKPQEDKLLGLIGSTHDDETLAIAKERTTKGSDSLVPLISMTSSILPKNLATDETFYRTVPPTDAEIQLIIQLLKKLKWDYVHLVYTASPSKNSTAERFVNDATSRGICVATKVALSSSWLQLEKFTEAVYRMMNVSGATGVVLMTDETCTEKLLMAAKEARAHGKLFWIGTESWQYTSWIEDLQDIALGALTIAPDRTINSKFGQYFTSLSIVNGSDIAWFKEYWQSYFECNLATGELFGKTCTANLKLNSSGEYEQPWETPGVINAVYAFAHAVKTVAEKCSSEEIQCNETLVDTIQHDVVIRELQHVNFAPPGGVKFFFRDRSGQGSFEIFNMQPHRGSYRFIQVGKYNSGELSLSMHDTGMYQNGNRLIPLSKCPGQCKVCLTDLFLAEYGAKVKKLEAEGPPLNHHLNRAIGIVMISLLCLGVGFTALLVFYLIKLTGSRRLFVELSVDASIALIVGVLLLYLSNITFLFSATNATCGVRRICLGLAYCLCFSAQLVDVARLAVVKQLPSEANIKLVLQAKRAHVYIPVLLAGQVVPTIFWLLLEPSGALLIVPLPQDIASLDEVQATWRCKIDRYELVCSLAYDAVLLLHSMILAILNRNVTSGYGVRPARAVLLSSIFSICIWVVWIPLYLHLENNDAYLALVSVGISLDATFMLGINFMPKVVTLMDQSEENPLRDFANSLRPGYWYRQFYNEQSARRNSDDDKKLSSNGDTINANTNKTDGKTRDGRRCSDDSATKAGPNDDDDGRTVNDECRSSRDSMTETGRKSLFRNRTSIISSIVRVKRADSKENETPSQQGPTSPV